MTIEYAIERIIADSGEDIFLCVEDLGSRPKIFFRRAKPGCEFRAALRAPDSLSGTYPLFDPESGDVELAGYGPTARDALVALRAVLDHFFA